MRIAPFLAGKRARRRRVDSYEDRLRTLEDRAEIANLLASYGPLADSGDAQGVASLWVEDGEYHIGGFGSAKGYEAIAALITGPTHQELMAKGCAHILSPHTISLEGDRAEAKGYSAVFVSDEQGFRPYRISANHWHFVRTQQGWRVQRRDNELLNGAAAARALLAL